MLKAQEEKRAKNLFGGVESMDEGMLNRRGEVIVACIDYGVCVFVYVHTFQLVRNRYDIFIC